MSGDGVLDAVVQRIYTCEVFDAQGIVMLYGILGLGKGGLGGGER